MNIPELLQQLTLEEKAGLCSGGTSGTPSRWSAWASLP